MSFPMRALLRTGSWIGPWVTFALAVNLAAACKNRSPESNIAESEYDPSVLNGIEDHVHAEDFGEWQQYLKNAERDPDVIRRMMEAAAQEFQVPLKLLMVIGQVETNWTQIGPSIDRGWGIMHLVDNHYANTLGQAAELLGVPKEQVRDDARTNIRGMAALLAHEAGERKAGWKRLEDWYPAVKKVTGLADGPEQISQATKYYEVLKTGIRSRTIFNTYVELAANPEIQVVFEPIFEPESGAEYPDATNDYIPCNYTAGRRVKVDTWTNHYIAVGSVNGARSWFKNCRGSGGSSAHFLVARDGRVFQFRPTSDTTYHAGTSLAGFRNNNHRSIGVEHEVLATHPDQWNEERLLNTSVKLANHFIGKYGIPRNRVRGNNNSPGIRGHNDMPGTNTSCPGPLPWDRWFAKLNGASSPAPTPPSSSPSAPSQPGFVTNAYVQGDFLYVRDEGGAIVQGRRVDNGDHISVRKVNYDKQLLFVEYPTPSGKASGWVSNAKIIYFKHQGAYRNGSTKENVLDDAGVVIGSLSPTEAATPLFRGANGMLYVIYNTAKGPNTKGGYVKYNGGFNQF